MGARGGVGYLGSLSEGQIHQSSLLWSVLPVDRTFDNAAGDTPHFIQVLGLRPTQEL